MPQQNPPPSIHTHVGNVASFPILSRWLFMNHAGVAPVPQRSADAIIQFAREAAESAYMEGHWYRQVEDLRTLAAGLINVTREEIALVKNTSEGLGIVASGVQLERGRPHRHLGRGVSVQCLSMARPCRAAGRRIGLRARAGA